MYIVYTLVLATFSKPPVITILNYSAHIEFVVTGPLTHITEKNCVAETDTCTNSSIPIPGGDNKIARERRASQGQMISSADKDNGAPHISFPHGLALFNRVARGIMEETHNFNETVPLADPTGTADSYTFTFWFFDGDDLLRSTGHTESVERPNIVNPSPGR